MPRFLTTQETSESNLLFLPFSLPYCLSSKAALNQIIRTLSHELNRRSPQHPAFCIAYHPGTMRTALSEPYTRGQTPQNTKGLFDVDQAADKLVELLKGMTAAKSGGFWAYDGRRVPW